MKNRRKRNNFIVLVLTVSILAIIVLVGFFIQKKKYENIFCKDTFINGLDCSLMTVEEAEEVIQNKQQEYVIEIVFKDNEVEYISGEEIEFTITKLEEQLGSIKQRQKKDFFLRGGVYNFDEKSYDKERLKKVLSSKKQLSQDYMESKTEMKYVFNEDKKIFELNVEKSYFLDFDEVLLAISNAIEEEKSTINLQDMYISIYRNSTLDELNSLICAEIIYELPDEEEYVLDAGILHTWLVQDDKGNYLKDEEVWNDKIQSFVEETLAPMVNTLGSMREFKPTGRSNTVLVEGKTYGFLLDNENEIEKLKEELNTKTPIVREPCYKRKEVSTENYGLGKSYVEIDLTRQKVFVYVDGNLELETDCVTGCINKGHETPTGIFTLTYKTKNKVLRGKKLADGRYEYESHVNYWMPFNGGIGLHDATWRKSFGGDIYINNGSHGCINLPLEAAEELYSIINNDMLIIVYKS